MLKERQVLNNVGELKNMAEARKYKYRRNYRYYTYTRSADIDNIKNPATIGYMNQREFGEEDDTTELPQINVIASCIDTLVSKIAQTKVRPFFNTINGSFKDIQIVKQAQHFFDVLFDEQKVHQKVALAFKNGCIFDTGVIYVDEDSQKIENALPFQIYIRPSEMTYGNITRVYYERKDFPVPLLPEKVYGKFKNKNLEYVDYGIYYDKFNKTKSYICNGSHVLSESYDKDVLPFIFMHYKEPITGSTSVSVVDMLYSIQQEINILMAKIKDASQLNPAMTFFMPEGSTAKATQLNNRVGNVIKYKPINGSGVPVISSTPAFIDGQYMTTLNELVDKAYSMVGISQLSSQSVKPTGLDSGVALGTMENIESDRFETQLNQVIRCYVDIAKVCINVFNEDENVLPDIASRTSIKWRDIVHESKNMSIQYSGADNLSKDPSTKLQQLQQLAMAGVIPSARISQLMQIPDLEMGYSLSNNAIDAVMEVIKECIEDDNFNVPEYIPFMLLKEEIINTQLSLKKAGKKANDKDITKLTKLYEIVEDMETEWSDAAVAENQGEVTEGGLPYSTNILEQEAGMTREEVPQDMDVTTSQPNEMGDWVTDNDYNRV